MKRCLDVLLNKVFKKDLEILYGVGSIVVINDIKYCTTNHGVLIDCKILLTDIGLFESVGLDGLKFLIEESWKFTGFFDEKLIVVSTYDLK